KSCIKSFSLRILPIIVLRVVTSTHSLIIETLPTGGVFVVLEPRNVKARNRESRFPASQRITDRRP
ncbi:hypothetical protein, partial [Enterobacter hormaechei]|uniref:hypothetical protein n=1 Tax=Enterobacter hormaechei TaxID=158836 RepID=UPI002042253F